MDWESMTDEQRQQAYLELVDEKKGLETTNNELVTKLSTTEQQLNESRLHAQKLFLRVTEDKPRIEIEGVTEPITLEKYIEGLKEE